MKRRKKRTYLLCFAIFHLSLICLASFTSDYTTAREYFAGFKVTKKKFTSDLLSKRLSDVLGAPILSNYTVISGIDAGYGFFAPNVASSYVLECIQKDKNNIKLNIFYYPPFKTQEGLLRYGTLLSTFQERMKALKIKDEKSLYTRYLDILIKSIGKDVLKSNPNPNAVNSTVSLYLYTYPKLNEYIMGNRSPSLIRLVNFEIHKDVNTQAKLSSIK